MIRRTLAALFLALLAASPALAQTGQINGVITDNTGGVVPGATVKAVETATGLSRDTVTGADGRYHLHVAAADHLRHHRRACRVPDVCSAKTSLLQANQNLTVNFTLELGTCRKRSRSPGESPTVDVTIGDPQRSRRLETHRRTAAERSRCRDAEHAGAGHGAHDGRSGIGENDSRRAADVDQRHRIAAGRRSGWTARATPIRTTSRISRSRFPTRCRNSAFRPATTAPPRATAPARSSTRSPGLAPTTSTAARSATCAIASSTRRITSRPSRTS